MQYTIELTLQQYLHLFCTLCLPMGCTCGTLQAFGMFEYISKKYFLSLSSFISSTYFLVSLLFFSWFYPLLITINFQIFPFPSFLFRLFPFHLSPFTLSLAYFVISPFPPSLFFASSVIILLYVPLLFASLPHFFTFVLKVAYRMLLACAWALPPCFFFVYLYKKRSDKRSDKAALYDLDDEDLHDMWDNLLKRDDERGEYGIINDDEEEGDEDRPPKKKKQNQKQKPIKRSFSLDFVAEVSPPPFFFKIFF
jgi:hypothetical protein